MKLIESTSFAIFGAAGNMGRGIANLLVEQVVSYRIRKRIEISPNSFKIHLIDKSESVFLIKEKLKLILFRYAEKNINDLRSYYEDDLDLVSNKGMIDHLVEISINNVHLSHQLTDAQIAFEAIVEDKEEKVNLFQKLEKICSEETVFLSNTSSIPIHYLREKSKVDRIYGFHFYNPAHIQKLLEMVSTDRNDVIDLAEDLGKKVIVSNDIAGFIGNGFFLREIAFACQKVKELKVDDPISFIDAVYRDHLNRPMGIFELIHFVGVEVCIHIAETMFAFKSMEPFDFSLLKQLPFPKKSPAEKNDLATQLARSFLEEDKRIAAELVERGVCNSVEDVDQVLMLGFHHPCGVSA